MAKEYYEKRDRMIDNRAERLLAVLPGTVKGFYEDELTHTASTTAYMRLNDVRDFLAFSLTVDPTLADREMTEIPDSFYEGRRIPDIYAFRHFLEDQGLSAHTINRKLSTLSRFFIYLNRNGICLSNPLPSVTRLKTKVPTPIVLSDDQIEALLSGVKNNNRYLKTGRDQLGNKTFAVLPIDRPTAMKRDRTVRRNTAILECFLSLGISLSELVSINLEDLDRENRTIRIFGRGESVRLVSYPENVEKALSFYLDRPALPSYYTKTYEPTQLSLMQDFAENALTDPAMRKKARQVFPGMDKSFYDDLEDLSCHLRRVSRDGLHPHSEALFLSIRGQRMSIRMVEVMVKEMVMTYLPDLMDREKFSVNQLRSVRVSRLLEENATISQIRDAIGYSSNMAAAYAVGKYK